MLDGFCEYLRQQGKSENTVKAYLSLIHISEPTRPY